MNANTNFSLLATLPKHDVLQIVTTGACLVQHAQDRFVPYVLHSQLKRDALRVIDEPLWSRNSFAFDFTSCGSPKPLKGGESMMIFQVFCEFKDESKVLQFIYFFDEKILSLAMQFLSHKATKPLRCGVQTVTKGDSPNTHPIVED